MSAKSSAAGAPAQGRVSPKPPGLKTYGVIDATSVEKAAWMTRIPPVLAKAWQDAPEGTVLGSFTFTKGSPPVAANGGGKGGAPAAAAKGDDAAPSTTTAAGPRVEQSLTITVSDELAASSPDLPVEYTIEGLTRKVPTLHPFTRRTDGSITLHGSVAKTANLQMERTERYRNLLKDRLVESVTSDRYVKPVELADLTSAGKGAGGGGGRSSRVGASVTNTGAAGSSRGGFGDSVQQFGKSILDSQKPGTDVGRKRRFEEQTIRSVVFDLFSSQRYWTLKDMRSASGRLEKEIREELSELAEFHRSGEHKGTWELRDEFR